MGTSVSKLDPHLILVSMYDNNFEESEASWFGIPDQENVYLQLGFENNPLTTYGIDYLAPTDLSTPLSPSGDSTLPLAVDIVNGELSTNNTTNDPASARARLTSAQMFNFDKLASELLDLYRNISHDTSASQLLYSLISDILDMSTEMLPGCSRVDVLVVPYEGRFCCPFADCQKKDTGWAAFRDARDHIWIDHLRRRFSCPQKGCRKAFGRVYDRNRHVRESHEGLGESFICTTCYKVFPRKFNLKRHIERHAFRNSTLCNRLRC